MRKFKVLGSIVAGVVIMSLIVKTIKRHKMKTTPYMTLTISQPTEDQLLESGKEWTLYTKSILNLKVWCYTLYAHCCFVLEELAVQTDTSVGDWYLIECDPVTLALTLGSPDHKAIIDVVDDGIMIDIYEVR